MSKLLFILFYTCCITEYSFAQLSSSISSHKKMQIGVEAGYNFSRIFSPFRGNTLGFKGSSAAISYQYNFKKNYSLRTGLYFYNKNFNDNNFSTGYSVESYGRYLSIPLLLNISHRKPKSTYYLFFGPSFEILLNSKNIENGNTIINNDKLLDAGIYVGIGYLRKLNNHFSINFEIRNTNTFLTSKGRNGFHSSLNSTCFMLGGAYHFCSRNTK
jgi:hypothetical protein